MSAQIASLVGKRILKESARNRFGTEDPYFEEVPASRLNRAFGKKTQKRRKAVPPGLSDNDAKVLTKVKRRAYRLDYCLFNLCGIQFGWSSVIALVPFAGDAADAALALMVMKTCEGIDGGLPGRLRTTMMMNIIIDFFIGLVPFVGDIADALYKCNSRNAVLLENHLRAKAAKKLSGQQQDPKDPSLPDEFDKIDNDNGPPRLDGPSGGQTLARPEPARHPHKNRSQKRWFGGSRQEPRDVEQGPGELERGVV